MLEHKIGAVPVVEGERLLGIITGDRRAQGVRQSADAAAAMRR
jgi:hypothetical protein